MEHWPCEKRTCVSPLGQATAGPDAGPARDDLDAFVVLLIWPRCHADKSFVSNLRMQSISFKNFEGHLSHANLEI